MSASEWDCNSLSIWSTEAGGLPQKESRERTAFAGASSATWGKNRAMRVLFETETQQIKTDSAQRKGSTHILETLTWNQDKAQPLLSFPRCGEVLTAAYLQTYLQPEKPQDRETVQDKGRTLEALRTPGSLTAAEVTVSSARTPASALSSACSILISCTCTAAAAQKHWDYQHALLPNLHSWTEKNWTDHLGTSASALISLTDLKYRYEPEFMLTLPHLWTESEPDRFLGRPLHLRNYLTFKILHISVQ